MSWYLSRTVAVPQMLFKNIVLADALDNPDTTCQQQLQIIRLKSQKYPLLATNHSN